ncbi:MAG TPA: metallophosphoesterase family protein [bacterium]|nr:metallophosphoesterase family protein [bacterium]HOL34931.1 metallophosphoesterase family protein [bacterium]HPP08299.1 metallophosphoesterase family protein [bacterium]
MLYGIISDIHGNLEAAMAVKDFLVKSGAEKILFLGDMVGYGVNPAECIDLFDLPNIIFIKGNHEEACITGRYEGFTLDAKMAMDWTRKNLSDDYKKKLSEWKETLEIEDFITCHGGLNDPLYFYTSSRSRAKKMFDEFSFHYCFVGHTHFPMVFVDEENKDMPSIIAEDPGGGLRVLIEENKRYILNVGSVGQPRDGNPQACCCLYDSKSRLFQLFRIPYPAEIASKKIADAGLPSSLAARILRGL